MTKAMICVRCLDIVAPHRAWQTDRSWRWCECAGAGTRWRDGAAGVLEVTSRDGTAGVRVLGLNNAFLIPALAGVESFSYGGEDEMEEWRVLHDLTCEQVPCHYLFHESRWECWAVVLRVGETGDVKFVHYSMALDGAEVPSPASSGG